LNKIIKKIMKRVISCSRRTDIPAFYTNWLINRIRDGYCHVINPYGSQVYYVSLKPEDCLAFVFWTRNPNPLLNHLSEFDIRGYKYYFHFTLIKYPELLESNTPDLNKSIDNFKKLSDMIGPNNVRWRYDPIIISSITNYDYHIENFSSIAKQLQSYTNHCTFSFVDFYGKTLRNLNRISVSSNLKFLDISLSRKISLIKNLNEIGKD